MKRRALALMPALSAVTPTIDSAKESIMSRLRRIGFAALSICGLTLIPMASGPRPAAAAPWPVLSDVTDTSLCSFPFESVVRADPTTHVQAPQGSAVKYIFTGPVQFTLTNLASGYSTTVGSSGPVSYSVVNNVYTLQGDVTTGYTEPGAVHDGMAQLNANSLAETLTGQEQIVDPCVLLSPQTPPPPVVPQSTPAPWALPQDALAGIGYAGLEPLIFGTAEHIHVHLDIFVDGNPVTVPAGVGQVEPYQPDPVNYPGLYSTDIAYGPIHTHATSGILHVESDTPTVYTLGQFFDEWEVRLTSSCLGGYCTGGDKSLRVYVNGQQFNGSPRDVPLTPAGEIALVYGSPGVPSTIPSSYTPPASAADGSAWYYQFGFP